VSPGQRTLELGVSIPDLRRLVRYEVLPDGAEWRVGGVGGRRAGEVGKAIGILALRHGSGYEVVLQFADGAMDTFQPHTVFPHITQNAGLETAA
jgi:hypothetical protein